MNKKQKWSIIAIISMFMTGAGGTLENPAVQAMIEAWPNISTTNIRLMITLPSLVSMFVMMGIGNFVGKKMSYRTASMLGTVLSLGGGLVPFFLHPNWFFILIFRAMLGIGVGLFSIRNPLLMQSVPSEQLAKYIGIGGIFGNLCSVTINPIVGKLTTYGWQYAFLSNLMFLIPGILSLLFLKEPTELKPVLEKKAEWSKSKLPFSVYFYIIMQFFATMSLYPMLSGIASYLTEIGIASPTVAGYMLSIYTGGGLVGNATLSKFQKTLKDKFLFFTLLGPVLGCLAVVFTGNIVLISLGIFVSGFGFCSMMSVLQVYIGQICNKDNVAQASLVVLAINQLGVFLSSYYIAATAKLPLFSLEMENTYFSCAIVYLMLFGACLFLKKKVIPESQK